jgi:hypothetical protein
MDLDTEMFVNNDAANTFVKENILPLLEEKSLRECHRISFALGKILSRAESVLLKQPVKLSSLCGVLQETPDGSSQPSELSQNDQDRHPSSSDASQPEEGKQP